MHTYHVLLDTQLFYSFKLFKYDMRIAIKQLAIKRQSKMQLTEKKCFHETETLSQIPPLQYARSSNY